jgi:hypothetical protein
MKADQPEASAHEQAKSEFYRHRAKAGAQAEGCGNEKAETVSDGENPLLHADRHDT